MLVQIIGITGMMDIGLEMIKMDEKNITEAIDFTEALITAGTVNECLQTTIEKLWIF